MYPFINLSFWGQDLILSSYNIMAGIGLILAILILEYQLSVWSDSAEENNKIYCVSIAALFIALTSAYFFDALVHERSFYDGILQFKNQHSIHGFTFYGGFLGGISCGMVMLKIYRISKLKALNIVTPSIIFAHAVGRIGCFLSGCCYGRNFQIGHFSLKAPTQLMESFFLFLLGLIIIKWIQTKNRFFLYIICYGMFRFLVDFLRGDDRGTLIVTWLAPSQVVSIGLILAGVTFYLIQNYQNYFSIYSFQQGCVKIT